MKPRAPSAARNARSGFTLFEALISVALMGAIVAMLAAVSGQWIPNWRHGFGRLQHADLLDLGLQRVVADLQAAQFVSPNAAAPGPLFDGRETSVTLVRDAVGPDATPHLEVVNLAETVDERGFALVRSRAPFVIFPADTPFANLLHLTTPVVLIRAPFRVSFSFAGPDRVWRASWTDKPQLPVAVRIQVRDAATDRTLATSTAALLRVTVSPDCVAQASARDCANGLTPPPAGQPQSKAATPPGAATPAAQEL